MPLFTRLDQWTHFSLGRTFKLAPYSPDLAPTDFFLFPKVKGALAGIHMDHDDIKNVWEGVTNRITKE